MNDDFSIFWYNDEHAQGLFYDLLARSERDAYDDDFLAQLAAYREAAPASERADIFAAKYLLHHLNLMMNQRMSLSRLRVGVKLSFSLQVLTRVKKSQLLKFQTSLR